MTRPTIKTRPARKGPPPLSRSLMRLLSGLAGKSGAIDPRLISQWSDIVGDDIARLCRPVRMHTQGRAKTLEIATSHGAGAMAVQYKQQEIITKVNRWLGTSTLTRLTIRQTGARAVRGDATNSAKRDQGNKAAVRAVTGNARTSDEAGIGHPNPFQGLPQRPEKPQAPPRHRSPAPASSPHRSETALNKALNELKNNLNSRR